MNTPDRDLADLLAHAPFPVHLIGDATGGRTIQQAINQATTLARAL